MYLSVLYNCIYLTWETPSHQLGGGGGGGGGGRGGGGGGGGWQVGGVHLTGASITGYTCATADALTTAAVVVSLLMTMVTPAIRR